MPRPRPGLPLPRVPWTAGLLLTLALGAGTPERPARAAEVAGERLPGEVEVAGRRLALAACAPREVLWEDLYALGIYLPRRTTDLGYVRDPSTPKAIRLAVAYEGDVPDELPAEWRERLRSELPNDLMERFERRYASIKGGDRITATYAAGRGTTVLVNGEAILETGDHGLMDTLLGLWIGRDPVSGAMRDELLAGDC